MILLFSIPDWSLIIGFITILSSLVIIYRFVRSWHQSLLEERYELGYEDGREEGFDEGYNRAKKNVESEPYTARNERVLNQSIEAIKGKHAEELWKDAEDYVYFSSLTGYPWLPDPEVIRNLTENGVEVRILLTAPTEEIMTDLMKLERVENHDNILNPDDTTISERRKKDIEEGIQKTLDKLVPILPSENIKFSQKIPIWKGAIIDGVKARYVLYDMPRKDVPFRYTEEQLLVEFIEERYFNRLWKEARPLDELKTTYSFSTDVATG